METTVGKERFCDIFKGRVVVVTDLPAGHGRDRRTGPMRQRAAETRRFARRPRYLALFGLLREETD